MTGLGQYNIEQDRFVLNIKTTGRWTCDVEYVRRGERINLSGKCDGKPIKADRDDNHRDKHQMPNLSDSKQD